MGFYLNKVELPFQVDLQLSAIMRGQCLALLYSRVKCLNKLNVHRRLALSNNFGSALLVSSTNSAVLLPSASYHTAETLFKKIDMPNFGKHKNKRKEKKGDSKTELKDFIKDVSDEMYPDKINSGPEKKRVQLDLFEQLMKMEPSEPVPETKLVRETEPVRETGPDQDRHIFDLIKGSRRSYF